MNALQPLLFALTVIAVLRALLQYTDADFNNNISQIVHKLTKFPIMVLRRFVPRIQGSDLGSPFLLALLLATFDRYLYLSASDTPIQIVALLVLALVQILQIALNIVTFAILIRVILSWVYRKSNSFTRLILTFTEPILAPARRLIPTLGGIDFSPILVLLALELGGNIITRFLANIAYQLLRS